MYKSATVLLLNNDKHDIRVTLQQQYLLRVHWIGPTHWAMVKVTISVHVPWEHTRHTPKHLIPMEVNTNNLPKIVNVFFKSLIKLMECTTLQKVNKKVSILKSKTSKLKLLTEVRVKEEKIQATQVINGYKIKLK